MNPKQNNRVQSPYVVVIGGNSVRRKGTSTPPDTHLDASIHHGPLPEKPEAPQVYGVVPPLKTMARDLKEVTPVHAGEQSKKKWWKRNEKIAHRVDEKKSPPQTERIAPSVSSKKWWNFSKRKAQTSSKEAETTQRIQGHTLERMTQAPAHQRVIDIPSEADRAKPSPYRGRFMRGIAKKGYLTSKLAVELPFHAKVGALVALLVIVVGVPLLSRFSAKSAPVTAGTVVALGTEALVAHVGKSIELPTGETPLVVLATADDIRRLNVPDAKPGNKILLYQRSGKIVVYDAEEDKVLGVVNRSQP